MIATASLAWAIAAGAATTSNDVFQVLTEQTVCPEYGTMTYRRVLACGEVRLAFQPPDGWKASADAATRTLLFEGPTPDTQMRLRVILPQRAGTNAPPALPPAPELKAALARLVPSAEIAVESECPAPGASGKSCDFTFASGARRFQGRLAWLTYPNCQLELILTTGSGLARHHMSFVQLVNSLEMLPLRKAIPANR